MSKVGKGARPGRELSKDAILEVAADLFRAKGYRATSLEQVAQRFGVQRPAIYYYFRNKAAILCEIHNRLLRELTAELDRVVGLDLPADEVLEALIRGQVRIYAANISALTVFLENESELPPQEARHAQAEKRRYNRELERIYAEGVAQGAFVDVNPRLAVFGLTGITGWMYRWYDPNGTYDPDEIADVLLSIGAGGYRVAGARTS